MKKLYKIATIIMLIGLLFWFIETIYFLIAHGWHLEAHNDAERTCDVISSFIMNVAIFLWVVILIHVVDKAVDKTEE